MRILRVAQKVYPEHTGGGAYHVHAMSRDQATKGHDVTVLTVGDEMARKERDGYTVVQCPTLLSLLGNDIAPRIWQYLQNTKGYDVVHAHSHIYFSTNLTAINRQFDGTPLAITNHGLYSQNAPEWLFNVYLRTLGRWTFNAADKVFCYTEVERQRIREFGVNSSIQVVSNGIDTSQFTPYGPTPKWSDQSTNILFVGRLVEGKRPGDIVDAVAKLRQYQDDVQLFVVGDGPLSEELHQRAERRGIGTAVHFLGHMPYEEMPIIYRGSDIFALPSEAEGVPRTVLEAMASEIPVVTSNLPQLKPIVSGAGQTVPVGDINTLADAIGEMITNSSLADRRGEAGRNRIEEEFDWESTVEETTTVLSDIVRTQDSSSTSSSTR